MTTNYFDNTARLSNKEVVGLGFDNIWNPSLPECR
jgi:hypothetical protein